MAIDVGGAVADAVELSDVPDAIANGVDAVVAVGPGLGLERTPRLGGYGQLPFALWSSAWSQSRFSASNALIFRHASQRATAITHA